MKEMNYNLGMAGALTTLLRVHASKDVDVMNHDMVKRAIFTSQLHSNAPGETIFWP